MPLAMWTLMGTGNHAALDGVNIGARWRIRLNHESALVMRRYVKLL